MSWISFSGDYNSSVQALTLDDVISYDNLNRQLKGLSKNDSIIINGIASAIVTEKIKTPIILTESHITINGNFNVYGDIRIWGVSININESVLITTDSVITLNQSDIGPGVTKGTAGIKIDRANGKFASFLFYEDDDRFKFNYSGINAKSISVSWLKNDYITLKEIDSTILTNGQKPVIYNDNNILRIINDNSSISVPLIRGIGRYNDKISNQIEFNNYFGSSTLRGVGSTTKGINYSFIYDKGYENGTDADIDSPNGSLNQDNNFMPLSGTSGSFSGTLISLGGNIWNTYSTSPKEGSGVTFTGVPPLSIDYKSLLLAPPVGTNRQWNGYANVSFNGMRHMFFPKTISNDKLGGFAKVYYDFIAYEEAFDGNSSLCVIDKEGSVYKDSINDNNLVVSSSGIIGVAGGGVLERTGVVKVYPNNTNVILSSGCYRMSTEINLGNNITIHGKSKNETIIKPVNKTSRFVTSDKQKISFNNLTINGSTLGTQAAVSQSITNYINGSNVNLNKPSDTYNIGSMFIPVTGNAVDRTLFKVGQNTWGTSSLTAGNTDSLIGSSLSNGAIYGRACFTPENSWISFAGSEYNGIKTIYLPKYINNDSEGGSVSYYYNSQAWKYAFSSLSSDIIITQNGSVYKNNTANSSLVNRWDGEYGVAVSGLFTGETAYEYLNIPIVNDTIGRYSSKYVSLFDLDNVRNSEFLNDVTNFTNNKIYDGHKNNRNNYFGNVYYNSSIAFYNCSLGKYFGRYESNLRNTFDCNGVIKGFFETSSVSSTIGIIGTGDFNF
jgi:hypothetical protein